MRSSKCALPVQGRPARRSASAFVKKTVEPEGLLRPQFSARELCVRAETSRCRRASASVVGERTLQRRRAAGDTPSRRRDLRVPADATPREEAACAKQILSRAGAPRLSPAGRRPTTSQTLADFYAQGREDGELRCRHPVRRSSGCSSAPTSCSASSAIRPASHPAPCTRVQRSRAGVAAVVLPVEQHPGRRAARRRRARAS